MGTIREFCMIEVWRQGYFPESEYYLEAVSRMERGFQWAKERSKLRHICDNGHIFDGEATYGPSDDGRYMYHYGPECLLCGEEGKPLPNIPKVSDVLSLGVLIDPSNSVNHWRTTDVRIRGSEDIPPGADEVRNRMARLFCMIEYMTPEEFYKEFMMVHPFVDGNGRTGKVVYNWMKGTLDNPVFPPNFFGTGVP